MDKKITDFIDEKIVVCEILLKKKYYWLVKKRGNEKKGKERDNKDIGVFRYTKCVWQVQCVLKCKWKLIKCL